MYFYYIKNNFKKMFIRRFDLNKRINLKIIRLEIRRLSRIK